MILAEALSWKEFEKMAKDPLVQKQGQVFIDKAARTAIAILVRVPKPGFSRNGIQINRTKHPVTNVAHPSVSPVLILSPCAKTVQGALPRFD
jgi:hypothetical protein